MRSPFGFLLAVTAMACHHSTSPSPTSSIVVNSLTTGVSFDPDGYVLDVMGPVTDQIRVGTNGTKTLAFPQAGSYTIAVSDVSPNCTLADPGPFQVTLVEGQTDTLALAATCTHANGAIVVAIISAIPGTMQPSVVTLDRIDSRTVDSVGTLLFTDLADGKHLLEASRASSACGLQPTIDSVAVAGGDTAHAVLTYDCT